MANKKVSEFDSATPVGTDVFPFTDDPSGTPVSKKSTFTALAGWLASLTQTLTNKTIAAGSNTISGLTIGSEVTGASTALSDTAALTYNADTNVSGNGWVLDEDTMSSDSATKVPTQQSVKAYVDNSVLSEVHLEHTETAGTSGGGSSATTWNKRVLTETRDNDSKCTVTSGVFVLAAGTWEVVSGWGCVHGAVLEHQLRIRNTTANSTLVVGSSAYCTATTGQAISHLPAGARFTVAASQNLELQQYTEAAIATYGLGYRVDAGETEHYVSLLLKQIS